MALYPIILAGGVGSRLWPLSRQNHPKQFLDVLGCGETLLQSTIKRAQACSDIAPLIIAHQDHRFLLQHQIAPLGLSCEQVLLEPCAKNTTAAIAIACLEIFKKDKNATVFVLPADHYLPDTVQFKNTLTQFITSLKAESIGIAGVKPTYPATQYGYMAMQSSQGVNRVTRFIEKPATDAAHDLFEQQNIAWNSGLVIGRADTLLNALDQYAADTLALAKQAWLNAKPLYDFKVVGDIYHNITSEAFDVSVLEKNTDLIACRLEQVWDDLGSWSSLLARRQSLKKENYNVFSEGSAVLAFGADNMVLVKNDDILFMAHKDALNDMTSIAHYLKDNGLQGLLNRIDVHRPWGRFKVLAQQSHFIVKLLIVLPRSQISLQSHVHRQENWVVVKGHACVQLDDKSVELGVGESISIGPEQKHRLHNPTNDTLEIIEVQSGSCLDESDIVRYDDQYQRHLHNQ